MTKVINIFGGPGSGKSTLAAGLFYEMKKKGYRVELVTEYAKELVYNETLHTTSQQEIIDVQYARQEVFYHDDVDYVITDAPTAISLIYGEKELTGEQVKTVERLITGVQSFNYILPSNRYTYVAQGRVQPKEESCEIKRKIVEFFKETPFFYREYNSFRTSDDIIKDIIEDVSSWD